MRPTDPSPVSPSHHLPVSRTGGTEEEQWNNETDDDDIKPAKLSKRHKVGGRSPMSHSPVPMHIPRNRPVVEVNDPPVVYMLDQKAFDEDWHAMMRL